MILAYMAMAYFCMLHYVTQFVILKEKYMLFEWDEKKEKKNIIAHGIDFNTALLVFGDDNRIEKYDRKHSIYEDRYITIGEIGDMIAVIMVVYTERNEIIRIISARPATKLEKEAYYYGKS